MNCMKCGRDIEEGQVFCAACLEDMAKYPVKPGIAIQLPRRKDSPAVKKHIRRRQPPTPEEQIQRLKKRFWRMFTIWLITLALLAATLYPTARYFLDKQILLPGQNYTTVTDLDASTP